jgi:hypothetical protein
MQNFKNIAVSELLHYTAIGHFANKNIISCSNVYFEGGVLLSVNGVESFDPLPNIVVDDFCIL